MNAIDAADPFTALLNEVLGGIVALGVLYALGCAAVALRRKLRRRPAPEVGDDTLAMLGRPGGDDA